MNPVAHTPWRPSSPQRIEAFAHVLRAVGLRTTVRRNRGIEIGAACGQLAAELAGAPDAGGGRAPPGAAGRPQRAARAARIERRRPPVARHVRPRPVRDGDWRPQVAASILTADFGHLYRVVRKLERAGVDRLHLDVMDGHFVPNITFGPDVVRARSAA